MKSASVMILAGAVAAANAMKVALLSDLHLDLRYNSTASVDNACRGNSNDENSTSYAPLGRFGCDPPQILIENLIKKLLDQEGTPDVVIITGDLVAHDVALDYNGTDGENPLQMETLQAVTDLLAEYFPDTLVLPVLGNNDCYYHNNAPFTSEKLPFYTDLYKMWFNDLPENAKLPNLSNIKETFEYGGYYRVDLSDTVSVLSMNTMYFSKDDDVDMNPEEGWTELQWLEEQLKTAESGRKFFLSGHIYGGARYHASELWHDRFTSPYFTTLLKYHDKIIMELFGHDHYTDLRYHSSQGMPSDLDIDDDDKKFDFHNLIVNPGITPNKDQQPGFTVMDVNNSIPENLRMTFLDLTQYIGSKWAQAPAYKDIEWLYVDYAAKYGLKQLDASSLADFRKYLDDHHDTYISYLVTKLGFNENDSDEYDAAIAILTDKDLITSSKHKTDESSCLMHQNLSKNEYEDCTGKKYLTAPEMFLQ